MKNGIQFTNDGEYGRGRADITEVHILNSKLRDTMLISQG